MIEIRPMLTKDIAECMEIGRKSGLSYWSSDGFQDELARDDSVALVAENEIGIAGFIIGRVIQPEHIAEVYNIGVRSDSRRSGVGRELIEQFSAECRKHNVNTIWLEARASNSGALAFYERSGFVQIYVRKGFYSNPPEDAILMSKKI